MYFRLFLSAEELYQSLKGKMVHGVQIFVFMITLDHLYS